MSSDDDAGIQHQGSRKVREDGASTVITIPQRVLDNSDLEIGEQATFFTDDEGRVVLMPGSYGDILADQVEE